LRSIRRRTAGRIASGSTAIAAASAPTWPRFTWKSDTPARQQLGAGLEDLAGPRALGPLGVLTEHAAGVAQPQRRGPVGELRGGEPGHAGGEVVAQREQLAVQVEEPDQAVGDVRAPGAGEHFGVLEGGRDDLLVAGRLETGEHRALDAAAAPHGVAGEVERAGRDGGDRGTQRHATTRIVDTRRPSISTTSKVAP
jgi:hypothetical protein